MRRRVVLVVANRGVLMAINLSGGADQVVQLPGGLGRTAHPVEVHERVFIPDVEHGIVHVVDLDSGKLVTSVAIPGGAAPGLELLAHDDRVFYSDPSSDRAGVILPDGSRTSISKYDPNNPGSGVTRVPSVPDPIVPTSVPTTRYGTTSTRP